MQVTSDGIHGSVDDERDDGYPLEMKPNSIHGTDNRDKGGNGSHSIVHSQLKVAAAKGENIRINNKEKPYKFDRCDFSAACRSKLIEHFRIHTGGKLYKCELCDYSATKKSILVIHSRIHTGEKPFKFKVCDYAATTKSHLVKHSRTHTGEAPQALRRGDIVTNEDSSGVFKI